MVDGVKGCNEVKHDEDSEVARIREEEEVIADFEEGCFSVVLWVFIQA